MPAFFLIRPSFLPSSLPPFLPSSLPAPIVTTVQESNGGGGSAALGFGESASTETVNIGVLSPPCFDPATIQGIQWMFSAGSGGTGSEAGPDVGLTAGGGGDDQGGGETTSEAGAGVMLAAEGGTGAASFEFTQGDVDQLRQSAGQTTVTQTNDNQTSSSAFVDLDYLAFDFFQNEGGLT